MQDNSDKAFEQALYLIKVINDNGFEARLVGGCVRDRLLGLIPKDYDVASTAEPEELITLLKKENIKFIPTAPEHGTITVIFPDSPIEVTTLREDVVTDGRRAIVMFGKSFKEDAKRRDFTINSLSEDINGQIYDYFGGQEDLKAQKLVFVGNAKQRISEDYLRTLRLFRFQSRLGFTFDDHTKLAVEQEREGLGDLSAERVTGEMEQILKGKFVEKALINMHEAKLWPIVFPFIRSDQAEKSSVEQVLKFCSTSLMKKSETPWVFVLAILYIHCFDSNDAKELLNKIDSYCRQMKIALSHMDQVKTLVSGFLRLKKSFSDRADSLLFIEKCEKKKRSKDFFAYSCLPLWKFLNSFDNNRELSMVLSSLEKTYSNHRDLLKSQLPLSSKEVIDILGKVPGPEVGDALDSLRREFLNGKLQSSKEMRAYLESKK